MPENTSVLCEESEEITYTCSYCGAVCEENELTEVGDNLYCDSCLEANTFICSNCGEREHEDNVCFVNEDPICESCYEDTVECRVCGDRVFSDDSDYIDHCAVCNTCRDHSEELATCYTCGETHFTGNMCYGDDDEYYCTYCYDSRKSIYGYHSGPRLQFYGSGKYHMGVELEVDRGDRGQRENSAEEVVQIMDDHVY